jgi:hypothetical protein
MTKSYLLMYIERLLPAIMIVHENAMLKTEPESEFLSKFIHRHFCTVQLDTTHDLRLPV